MAGNANEARSRWKLRGCGCRIRAIGFDLGDTLICYADTPLSWSSLYSEALSCVAAACEANPRAEDVHRAQEILASYNTRLTPRSHEVAASTVLGEILVAWRVDPDVQLHAAIEAFFAFFQRRIAPSEVAVSVLSGLRARGMPIGILTDVPYGMPRRFVENDLSTAGITEFVDVLLTSHDVGMRKPDPAGYIALASQLGVPAEELLYVGNEEKDIAGAKAAGVQSALLMSNGTSCPVWGQTVTLASLDQLLAISD
ncbi:MAG: HAD family hydrolase [Chthoniobacterales bacterium]|nr:HAD family hydrolase [Chthoniobacterales bacterium]